MEDGFGKNQRPTRFPFPFFILFCFTFPCRTSLEILIWSYSVSLSLSIVYNIDDWSFDPTSKWSSNEHASSMQAFGWIWKKLANFIGFRFDSNSSRKRKLAINEVEALQHGYSKYKIRCNRSYSLNDSEDDDVEDEQHSVSNESSRSGESSSERIAPEFPVGLVKHEIQEYIDQNYDVIESESVSKDETRVDLEEEEEEEEHTSSATTCADIKEVPRKPTVDQEFEEYFSMLIL